MVLETQHHLNIQQNQDKEVLVYGRFKDGSILHVREAIKGIACLCTCLGCGARLIAKKGKILQQHFAHESSTNCGVTGPETALHMLAKQILCGVPEFPFPPVVAEFENVHHTLVGATKVSITSCDYESALKKLEFGIVPDLVFHSGTRRCQIEIAVTHKCDDIKIKKLKIAG